MHSTLGNGSSFVMSTETLSEAIDRLTALGYKDDFWAQSDGLRARLARTVHDPDSIIIEECVRFEGETDPSEEAILFALRCEKSGTKGTYTVAYGPGMDSLDAEMVARLKDGRRN